jgi:hypothetical protein
MKDKFDRVSYSNEIKVTNAGTAGAHYWPNPVNDKIYVELNVPGRTSATYSIVSSNGAKVKENHLDLKAGDQIVTIDVEGLTKGVYQFSITGDSIKQPVHFLFIKR